MGIAVSDATDAARAAADIVLTQPGLSTIVHGIVEARKIFQRIKNFLTYRVAASLQLLLFFFIAVFWFKPREYMPPDWRSNPAFADPQTGQPTPWPTYFRMPVIMLIVITCLNDFSLISIGYDSSDPDTLPSRWNLQALFSVSVVLALVALISSLLLLGLLLASWQPGSLFQRWGLGGVSFGQVTTAVYLKVSVSDFLTLFSARTGGNFFWSRAPSGPLFGATVFALSCSTVLALAWPPGTLDAVPVVGLAYLSPNLLAIYVWIYCLVWWGVQDVCKVVSLSLNL